MLMDRQSLAPKEAVAVEEGLAVADYMAALLAAQQLMLCAYHQVLYEAPDVSEACSTSHEGIVC